MSLFAVYNGASGGLGRHLGQALEESRIPNWPLQTRLGQVSEQLQELDRLELEAASRIVLIQSAALVPVAVAERDPDLAYDVNVSRTGATVAAFVEWAATSGHEPAVVFVSSSHVYAPAQPGIPLSEESPIGPVSVYAKTKLATEDRLRAVVTQAGAELVVARVFGMVGPNQRSGFVLPGLIRRVQSSDLSAVPGLHYVRDYLDARDVARHLASLAEGISGKRDGVLVNVCSGEATQVGELLDLVLAEVHRDDPGALRAARADVGAAEGRPTDVTWAVGDPSRLVEHSRAPIRAIPLATTVAEAVAAAPTITEPPKPP